ncbi:hypothetical protein [Levilactobacillus zymae]|uniref:hypothetical protein n=1 Tax=Levilactobacillus zymae TaxID=267363 RepID=UPI0028B93C5A|nr:hypothetical protein [Levilactobacillus zymae]MDT6979528.1 hypothetical protein [Levilactobacillus zymae]
MTRLNNLALVALTTMALGTVSTTTASAATWHTGTPKALRGKFQDRHKTAAQGFATEYTFTAKKFLWGISNMPLQTHSRLRYRKLGAHVYRLKGHVAHRGIVLAMTRDYVIYKKGKTLKLTYYSDYRKMGFKKVPVAHQVTHFN